MRVLLICDSGDGLLDLALRAQETGHQVKCFCRKYDARTRPIGKGLVELIPDWRQSMQWSDLVILEGNGFLMSEMDAWKRRGCLIIGGNAESASWELDREVGMGVLKKAGIPIPEYRLFHDYDQAIRYVEREGRVFFSKPCSDTADKSLSAKTGIDEDPTWQLRRWKKKHRTPPSPFILQEQISDGVETGVAGWWGPTGWVDTWEENFEGKRMMSTPDGNGCGPNTGEMHTVLRYVKRSKLAQQVLVPLESQLEKLGVAVCVDVNVIVDRDGTPWPLEFTMRLGWPSFNIETALFDCDPIEFLYAVANGESASGAHTLNKTAIGLVVALPPYPHAPKAYEDAMEIPIYGADENFHPCEIQRSTNPFFTLAADSPQPGDAEYGDYASAGHYLGVVTGLGDTVRQAAHRARAAFEKLSIPVSPFYRDDAGRRLRKQIPLLQEHGFAAGMEY